MTAYRNTAIAALVAASVGLTAMVPAALAEDRNPGFQRHEQGMKGQREADLRGNRNGGPGGGLIDLVCTPNGAERLEIGFVRLSHRIELTAEQTPLFEDLRTAALTAQTGYADTCETIRPAAADAAQQPDLLERFTTRLKLDEARVAALNTVLPAFEAFYGSLTDEQKSGLQMQRPDGNRDHMRGPAGDSPSDEMNG